MVDIVATIRREIYSKGIFDHNSSTMNRNYQLFIINKFWLQNLMEI